MVTSVLVTNLRGEILTRPKTRRLVRTAAERQAPDATSDTI